MTTETRWLSDDEQTLWRLILAAIRKIDRGMDETLQAVSSLSASEFAVLVTLSEAPEQSLRLRELCDELEWDRSRASHQITRMLRRGLVTKCKTASDARGVTVTITDDGLTRLQAAAPEHVESVRRLVFDHLDPNDWDALARFFTGVAQVKNLPGYSGFTPDPLLTAHRTEETSG